ncbi:hypothetical protein IW148_003552 [Coemansia sp. RSA 1199]|nr:hypothetical protein IW148_003552 [Coemansia sp. RSA 1199]
MCGAAVVRDHLGKQLDSVQHTLSQAACNSRDCVIEERMRYRIDELSTAFAQMPVFTITKPGTKVQHAQFNDLANNSLNMRAVGMQLPTPLKRALFLRDTKLLSSINMASFFTQLRLHKDIADY